ncbi:hypothetical protein EGW08_003977 [Elysia chlorotica]|uniref:Uncharacterized protein n=1 Tax=Elysia chlorotica TaxID=188477 RepID=A0A3S1BTE1_ELYCH|nr:hypothetical protein EGW08_003977 [Elysia chlorotica]
MASNTTRDGRQLRVVAPDHVYHYPCFRRANLASIKHQILRPDFPTFRRLERDDLLHKLPDEHCRTTTSCTTFDFRNATMNPLIQPIKEFHCMDCTETGYAVKKSYFTPIDIQRQNLIWRKYMNNPLVYAAVKTKENPLVDPRPVLNKNCGCDGAKNLQFDGAPVRYTNADLRNWRFTLKCEPHIKKNRQQPVPTDVAFPREVIPHPQSLKPKPCKS